MPALMKPSPTTTTTTSLFFCLIFFSHLQLALLHTTTTTTTPPLLQPSHLFPFLWQFPDPTQPTPSVSASASASESASASANLTVEPVVICPGTPGSMLQGKLHDDRPPHLLCRHNTEEWFVLYLDRRDLYPEFAECWAYNMQVRYNVVNNSWANTTGVEVRPLDYGGFNGTYFQNLTDYFTTHAGYQIGKNLFAATFDWRVDGHGATLIGGHAALQQLVEQAYHLNNGTKVHLLGHSGGAPYAHYFLTRYVSQQWKDRYINSLITMGGPWLGTPIASALLAGGVALMDPTGQLPRYLIKPLTEVLSTLALPVIFMPLEKYASDWLVVSTPSRNFSGAEALQLLAVAGRETSLAIRLNNLEDYNNVPAPNVPVHCLYSTGIPTPQTFVFDSDDFSQVTSVTMVDGDSVVPVLSGSFCGSWKHQQSQPVVVKHVVNVSHSLMQNSPVVWDWLLSITTSTSTATTTTAG